LETGTLRSLGEGRKIGRAQFAESEITRQKYGGLASNVNATMGWAGRSEWKLRWQDARLHVKRRRCSNARRSGCTI